MTLRKLALRVLNNEMGIPTKDEQIIHIKNNQFKRGNITLYFDGPSEASRSQYIGDNNAPGEKYLRDGKTKGIHWHATSTNSRAA